MRLKTKVYFLEFIDHLCLSMFSFTGLACFFIFIRIKKFEEYGDWIYKAKYFKSPEAFAEITKYYMDKHVEPTSQMLVVYLVLDLLIRYIWVKKTR